MRTMQILVLACTSLLMVGCASHRYHSHSAKHPPAKTSSPAANLLIISATYGSGTHFSDVTDRVNDLLRQPDVEFFARPEWLKADPTPGWNKALTIVYEFKGQRHIFTAGEGGEVSVDTLICQADK